jgi:glycosyltransferase involved in cell wall biosynthesis
MRILVFSENFFPDMGGLERNTFTLASTLSTLGHEVTVLTGTLRSDNEIYPFKVVRSKSKVEYFSVIKNSDLIFINGGIALKICLAALVLRKKYLPIYITYNTYISENQSFTAKMALRLRKYLANKAIVNITLSQYTKELLQSLSPNHAVEILLNPIDGELERIAEQKKGLSDNKIFDVLFAGRMIEGKGIFILIDAISKLKSLLNLKIAFAGEGEDKEALLAYAKEQQVEISYLGRLNNEQIIEAYLQSKVLIVPSSTHKEGNPLVIAEAISLGLPIIASDQPPMIEAVGDAGYIFSSGNADDLAQKIKQLFNGNNLQVKTSKTHIRKQAFSYAQYKITLDGILKKAVL